MKIKRILTTRAAAGMVAGDNVYTSDDRLVIPRGTVLTNEIIQALRDYSVFALQVQVDDENSNPVLIGEGMDNGEKAEVEAGLLQPPEISLEEDKSLDSIQNSIMDTEDFKEFNASFERNVEHLKDTLNNVVMHNEGVDSEELLEDVKEVVSKGSNSLRVLDMLQCIRGYNDVTYVHSVNVAMLSNMIGRLVKPDMSEEELDILTLSGLLHDVGKILVPEEIIGKNARLTLAEFSVAKTHVFHGNNILGKLKLDPRVAEVAMRHHERCDGSGYPGGYVMKQIEEFARIVAIADTFDAMTSERPYRPAICPFDVIHMFEREGMAKYDVKFLMPFLEMAAQAYINLSVRLSTGQVGKVVMINRRSLSRPVVQVGDTFYNLAKDKSISVTEILV